MSVTVCKGQEVGKLDPAKVDLSGISEELAWQIQAAADKERDRARLKARCQFVAAGLGAELVENPGRNCGEPMMVFQFWFKGHEPVTLAPPLLDKLEELLTKVHPVVDSRVAEVEARLMEKYRSAFPLHLSPLLSATEFTCPDCMADLALESGKLVFKMSAARKNVERMKS